MVRPTLWRFGDASNLYPGRETVLTALEWMACLYVREEMEYDLPTDTEQFRARIGVEPDINRFARDWVPHHMFTSLRLLAANQESTHAFLKGGGIAWASKVRHLTPGYLAEAARVGRPGDDIRAIGENMKTPKLVRDALQMMQMATAHVVGTDGHRRLCRHEAMRTPSSSALH